MLFNKLFYLDLPMTKESKDNTTYDKKYYPHLLSIPLDIRLKDPSENDIADEYDP